MDYVSSSSLYQRILSSSSSTSSKPLDSVSLLLALLCPISVVFLSLHLKLNIAQKIIISVTRTIVQLLFAG